LASYFAKHLKFQPISHLLTFYLKAVVNCILKNNVILACCEFYQWCKLFLCCDCCPITTERFTSVGGSYN